ncbi:PKD domain-containing protein [Flavobacterium suzhouense]|uniref:PKD domain-containing protein n=1 Tax=Flavobacterium suzhouense TaxID=1529638 RepID=A0ABW5P0C1_9FLAO
MKNIKILMLFMLTAFAISCSDDETSLGSVTNANPAGNISALFTITQDNTGLVTITPNAEGAVRFEVYDGDGATEPVELLPGQNMQHIYAEGVYPVKIVAYDITGKSSEATQELTVTFRAPENIEIIAIPVAGNSFGIDVTAKADYETFFEVTFGEAGETPIPFNEGQTVNHVYSAIGTYTITVVAYSGGVATSTATKEVTILDPLKLPLDFESATLTYSFIDFGGCATSLADNPDATGVNTSTKVAHMVKNAGEVWAGTAIQLEEVIDFTTYKAVKMKVWSPTAGIPVTLKVENAADSGINFENQQFTTVANAWETLVFDYSAIDASQEFSKLVIFFNLGTSGSGESYYFDDIEQTVSPLSITFESAVNMSSFGNAITTVEVNPDQTGINTSAGVGKFEKPNGAETWAGVAFPQNLPLDFSVMKKVKIKVWSPQAGIPVLLKFEKGDDNQVFIEKTQNTTVANAWEELTYDYSDVIDSSVPYQTPVVFFNFGATGDGSIYYFDDIKQSN